MKKIKLVVTVLIFMNFGVNSFANDCQGRDKPNSWSNIEKKTKFFCKQFDLIEVPVSVNGEEENEPDPNEKYKICFNLMNEYFQKVKETKSTIQMFVKKCREIGKVEVKSCANEILELSKHPKCYNMQSAADMIGTLGSSYNNYDTLSETPMPLTSSDWLLLHSITGFEIENCVEEFVNGSYKKSLALSRLYSEWLSKKDKKKLSDPKYLCNCVSIFGFEKIVAATIEKPKGEDRAEEKNSEIENVKENDNSAGETKDNDENIDSLRYGIEWFYSHLCRKENPGINKWKSQHYKELSRVATELTLEDVELFLKDAYEICDAGWGITEQNNFNRWPIESLMKILKFNQLHSIPYVSLQLLKRGLAIDFSAYDLKSFLFTFNGNCIVSEYVDQSRLMVFDVFFSENEVKEFKDKTLRNIEINRNEYFWIRNDKEIFTRHIKIFLAIYFLELGESSKQMKITPEEFVKPLLQIKNTVYSTLWSGNDIGELLEFSFIEGLKIDTIVKCFAFSNELEQKMNPYLESLTPRRSKSMYGIASDYFADFFRDFRRNLFSLDIVHREEIRKAEEASHSIEIEQEPKTVDRVCSKRYIEFSFESEEGIVNLLNYIFEEKHNNIESLVTTARIKIVEW